MKPSKKSTTVINPNRILIVRLSAFGDVIQTLPLLKELKKQYPTAHIGWLVESAAADLLAQHPDIDVLHVAHRKTWMKQLFQSPQQAWKALNAVHQFINGIKAQHYTVVIDAQGLFKSAIWGWVANIPQRVGYKPSREFAYWFYTHTHPCFSPINSSLHASQEFLSLLTVLDPTYSIPPASALRYDIPILPEAQLPSSTTVHISPEWLHHRTQYPIVALAPCTAWASKQWGITQWQTLATLLLKTNHRLVWVGSSADKLWIAELLAGIPAASADNSISWVGETTLPQLHTLFQHIDYFVGSDSVALHLANAYAQEHPHSRLKLVGLFGATKPSRTGTTVNPTNGVSTLLQAQIPLPCMPCHHKTCIFPVTDTRNHMACMQNLAPQQVMDVVMNASG